MHLFEMKNVSFREGNIQVINDISLSIETGSITAFLGTTGSGKSTALKLMAGIFPPSEGKVFYKDKNIHSMSRVQNLEFRKEAAFMFQDSALWANQDLYHNLELPLTIHFPEMPPAEKKERIETYAQIVKYSRPLTNRPAALSIGEQKRIAFARALICEPKILFLDEPTESIDDKTADLFISLLQKFCYNGGTLIYVSHDPHFVNSFKCDKYYFDGGSLQDKILQEDSILWGDESEI